jgi:peptide/nickel transport system ATP-binding protein
LLRRLQDETGMAILLITHNLGIVASMASRVLVMYAGRIVEEAKVEELFAHPLHPYTEGLLGATPRLFIDGRKAARLADIPGMVPAPDALPVGCGFAPRCPKVMTRCRSGKGAHRGSARRVACFATEGQA